MSEKRLHNLISILKDAFRTEDMDFTKGSIKRGLLVLSIPMILEMVMESLFAVVDVYFVSKLGNEAVAAVGLTESILYLVYSIGIGIAIAATAVIARRVGEKDPEEASRLGVQAFYLSLTASLIIGLIGLFFAKDMLRLMNGSDEVVNELSAYTQYMVGGSFVILMLFLFNGIFRRAGDAFLAMIVLTIANTINIILDPLLIFGIGPFPEMGLKGAAIATMIGRGSGIIIQIYLLLRGVGILKFIWKHFKADLQAIWHIFKISLGSIGQFITETVSWVFLVRLISEYGDAYLAAYVITIRVIIFTILPSWGLANAAATLVGQNLGANRPERSAKAAWLAATANVIFLGFIAILFSVTAKHIIAFFTSDVIVIKEGVIALRIICAGYIAFAFGMVLGQAFNGAGDTRTPTWVNFICFWLIQIPLAYYLAEVVGWETRGVYWAISIGHSLLAVTLIYLFSKGKWKKNGRLNFNRSFHSSKKSAINANGLRLLPSL